MWTWDLDLIFLCDSLFVQSVKSSWSKVLFKVLLLHVDGSYLVCSPAPGSSSSYVPHTHTQFISGSRLAAGLMRLLSPCSVRNVPRSHVLSHSHKEENNKPVKAVVQQIWWPKCEMERAVDPLESTSSLSPEPGRRCKAQAETWRVSGGLLTAHGGVRGRRRRVRTEQRAGSCWGLWNTHSKTCPGVHICNRRWTPDHTSHSSDLSWWVYKSELLIH